MSDRDDLANALHAADAAGDNDAAEHFAKALAALPDDAPKAKAAAAPRKTSLFTGKPEDARSDKLKKDSPTAWSDEFDPPEEIDVGALAKGAWNGTKRLALGAEQLSNKLSDPVTRKIGGLVGQGAETDKVLAAKQAKLSDEIKSANTEQAALSNKSPMNTFIGGSAPGALLAGPLTPELGIAGAVGRVANTAVGGGVQGAMEPVDDSGGGFAGKKVEQFGLGAALGGAMGVLGEAGSAAKKFVNQHLLFGDVGSAESPIQKYWNKARDMGFNISPQQARQDAGRLQTPGVTYTQREQNRIAANTAATKPTGVPGGVIDKDYLGDGFRRTSGEYDKIYGAGTSFKVDGSAVSQLQDFVSKSTAAQLGNPWANKEAMAAAEKLLDAYHGVAGAAGAGKNIKMNVDGQTLNRLVSELKSSSAKIKDGFEREDLGEVINSINESVARNNPAAKAALDKVNPQYRTLKTLENLSQRGGIDANGNIDPMALAKLLRGSDRGYLRGNSTHPLNDLAEVGETFGIRAQSQPTVAGGKPTSGVDIPTTRSGLLQHAIESGKEHTPGFKAGFTRYKLGESGNGLTQGEQQTIAGSVAAAENEERQREDSHR